MGLIREKSTESAALKCVATVFISEEKNSEIADDLSEVQILVEFI